MSVTEPSPRAAPSNAEGGFDGLIWGYQFFEGGAAEIVQGPALRTALERPDSWTWLHFDLDCEWTRATIASLPGLPPAAIAMLLSDDERQHKVRIAR